jgi:hypothetical protein
MPKQQDIFYAIIFFKTKEMIYIYLIHERMPMKEFGGKSQSSARNEPVSMTPEMQACLAARTPPAALLTWSSMRFRMNSSIY